MVPVGFALDLRERALAVAELQDCSPGFAPGGEGRDEIRPGFL